MKLKSFSRRNFLRAGAVAGVGVVGLAALAGCGEEEAPATQATAAPAATKAAEPAATAMAEKPKPAQIELEWWHQALIQMDDALKLIVKDYMGLNPHVTLTLNQFPFADFAAKLLTSLAGGVAPDVNYVHPQFVVQMAANGVIEPLDEYMKADAGFARDDFHSGSLEAMSYKGKAYTVPMFHGPWLYIYYKPLLENAGLELPWDLHQKGEWTIDAYQNMIETLSTGEGDERVWGGTEVPAALKLQYLWIWGFGGKVWDNRGAFDDPNEFVANSPEGVAGMQWAVDHVQQDLVPSRSYSKTFQGGNQGLFVSGRIGIYQSHRSFTTRIPADTPAGVAPMFKMPNGDDQSRDAPEGIGMHSATPDKDAAWDLVSYVGMEGVNHVIAAGVTAPTRKSQMSGEVFRNSIVAWDNIEVHIAASKQLKEQFFQPVAYGEINKIFQANYDEAVLGRKTVQEFLDDVKVEADRLLHE
ncbi:MAG: sugar ABC transporter substrate-binding protein [Chloroflexi bacterium]|nr:sugar ABC transporter substrate-binding protein [Chloroflexota bacterium]MCY3938713.1 sugar ABC transporter substrate-binding protein [Chloroflexota bacterium]